MVNLVAKHNTMIGHVCRMRTHLQSIIDSETASGEAKRIAKDMLEYSNLLEEQLREKRENVKMAQTAEVDETPPEYLIPFRVYTLPGGRQSEEVFSTSCKATYDMAQDVINAGFRFEAEVLRTGQVSFTVHDIEKEIDVAIELCDNGPAVREAIRKLVINGHKIACP